MLILALPTQEILGSLYSCFFSTSAFENGWNHELNNGKREKMIFHG